MTDELDLLHALRPAPAPSEDTVRRHRAQLREAIEFATADVVPGRGAPPSPGDAAWERADSRRAPTRRRRLTIAIGAAAAVVVTVASTVDRNSPTSVVAATPPHSPVAPDPGPAETFACGAELPATVDVAESLSGPTAGPASGNTRPVAEGQRVVHWSRPGGWVELRWPAATPAVYDLSEPRPGHGLGSYTSSPEHIELAVSSPGAARPTEPSRFDVAVDTTGWAEPTEACAVLEVEIVDASGTTRTGVDLRDLQASVYLGALVTGQERVAAAPTEALPCQAPSGIEAPPNRTGSGAPGASPAPTAAEALQQFLTTAEAAGFAPGGYTELVEPDGTITYGRLIDGGDEFVILVSVVPSGDGWIVDGWTASGC